jgi:hypothetical protein
MKVRDRRIIFMYVIKLLCRKIKRNPRTAARILSLQVECFQVIGQVVLPLLLRLTPASIPFNLEVRITIIIIIIIVIINK